MAITQKKTNTPVEPKTRIDFKVAVERLVSAGGFHVNGVDALPTFVFRSKGTSIVMVSAIIPHRL
jgi:hypothetical protein